MNTVYRILSMILWGAAALLAWQVATSPGTEANGPGLLMLGALLVAHHLQATIRATPPPTPPTP